MTKVSIRNKIIKKILGFNVNDIIQIKSLKDDLRWQFDELKKREDIRNYYVDKRLREINNLGDSSFNILKAQRDNLDYLRNKLWETRNKKSYKDVFINKNPLVSVRIATYNNADKLVNIALKSVLAQTYKNLEIIVIGDHCTDDTAKKINELNDARVTFINLPYRSIYPEDSHDRWCVAGSPGMNIGAYKSKGDWIAPLDDDDEFTPDHIEKLLKIALENRAEFAYGTILQKNNITGEVRELFSDPPMFNDFSFQGVIYMKELSFFEYDQQSWVVREPGDWNLCRRMLMAGVKIASTKDVIATIYMTPHNLKDKT